MSKRSRVGTFAIISVFAVGISVGTTEARGFGGGGGHPGGGGGGFRAGGGGAAHIGGGSFRGGSFGGGAGIRGVPGGAGGFSRSAIGRGFAPMGRTFSTPRSYSGLSPRNFSRMSGVGPRGFRQYTGRTSSGRLALRNAQLGSSSLANQNSFRDRGLVTGSVRGVGRASVLRNNAFASYASRHGSAGALRQASFHGGFAGKHWGRWGQHWGQGGWYWNHYHPIIAIGWVGSVFWPYAYWDFLDYTFWPYAYDAFWPYAYDDLYVGVFGPYAYEGPAYASRPSSSRRARRGHQQSATAAVVCTQRAPALTNWPIEQIAQTVQPTEAQQPALKDLKDATGKAVTALQTACPDDLPSTPTGRLAAMHKRVATMLLALSIVQPPLQQFYDSLTDEQKASFNAVSADDQTVRGKRGETTDFSQVCGAEALKVTNAPTDRIAQAINPTDDQRSALDALNGATGKARDFLKANCPAGEPSLTPPGRIAAMEQRLKTMLDAIKIVQPALESFYGSLTDEQKARFNLLGSQQS
jgi:LTXXQ motif family protein